MTAVSGRSGPSGSSLRIARYRSAFCHGLLALLLLPLDSAHAEPATDPWKEELLLQFSELRKSQGELRQQVTDLQAQVQALESAGKPPPITFDLRDTAYPVLGNAGADVAIVEFADYECPYCRRHQLNTVPGLTARYVDSGKLRYVFVNFPLAFHAGAEPAAIAGACAQQQRAYWKMRPLLFDSQASLQRNTFMKLAADLGLNSDQFKACLDDPQVATRVQAEARLGESVGVQGTPAFLVGRVRDGVLRDAVLVSGAQPLASFEQLIDPLLAGGAAVP